MPFPANNVTPIQLLRSLVPNKRPDPAKLLPGQAAVNTASNQPGFFVADSTGTSLVKIGPCTIGDYPPNSNQKVPDPFGGPDIYYWGNESSPAAPGNTLGELWLDTTSTVDSPGPKLKVWDGSQWINCMPYTYANTIVSNVEPALGTHPDGTLWWDSGTGLMYVLYNDGDSRQWTQVSGNPVQ
jgi:hypothetical protein